MYIVTLAGREIWESQDAAVPEDYRWVLWLIDVQGGSRAIKGLLLEHSAERVSGWLSDLEELRLIQARRNPADQTIPLTLNKPALQAGTEAAALLAGTGAYLAVNRSGRGRPAKSAAESTVLVVEDDPDQLALANLRLSIAGYRVRVASSVDQLLRSLLAEDQPDLLLLDVMLPDGNGFDVLSKMRRHPRFASLPIIMLTAKRDPADIGRGLAWGADGYVAKPYTKELLAKVIGSVLG